jgi:protein-tyrosine phosphatase
METMLPKWWIDRSWLLAGSNPTDEMLAGLRSQSFSLAVSLLDRQRSPKYDKHSAATSGWGVYRIPFDEGATPSLVQVCEFTAFVGAVSQSEARKILVFCDSGTGRSAFMGAVYWVAKGLNATAAKALVASNAGVKTPWSGRDWDEVLLAFEKLRWRI